MDHTATATSPYGCGCDSPAWTAEDTKGISGVRVLSGGHQLLTPSTPQDGTLTADWVSHPRGGGADAQQGERAPVPGRVCAVQPALPHPQLSQGMGERGREGDVRPRTPTQQLGSGFVSLEIAVSFIQPHCPLSAFVNSQRLGCGPPTQA